MQPDSALATYPKRPQFFAYRFCRLLVKMCVANEIGADGCWLLTVIAHTEDAKRYRGPVTFFNMQLAPLLGGNSDESLDNVRRKAIKGGWLHYEPGRKGVAGRYWVLIPEAYQDVEDGPCDENPTDLSPGLSPLNSGRKPEETPDTTQRKGEGKTGYNPEETAEHSSYPFPLPFSADVPSARETSEKNPEKTRRRKATSKPKTPAKEKAPRKPNPLFDALSEATGKDQEPSFIQTICTSLKERSFTPDDVREFAKHWRELLPWANKDEQPRLTPGIIKKWIHVLREQPVALQAAPTIKKASDHPSNRLPDICDQPGAKK